MNEYYSTLLHYIEEKRPCVAVIIVQGTGRYPAGSRFVFDAEGEEISGGLKLPESLAIGEKAREVLRQRTPKAFQWEVEGAPLRLFFDPVTPVYRLLILGGGHIAAPLAEVGTLTGFEVTVVDDRPAFASVSRFPSADQVICRDFGSAIKEYEADSATFVVIVTRGHRHDKFCLAEILRGQSPAYTGMIGSRRKVKAVLEELETEGFRREQLERVQAPIGLDIGAQTPEEIAVSIMAEIIMIKHYGYSNGLRVKRGGVEGGS